MAKKRLNRKVALIGSTIFVVGSLAIILAVLHFSRDPHKFIAEGDEILKTAKETTDPDLQTELFMQIQRKYGKALGLAKTDELKVEILYRSADLYKTSGEWRKVLGCWSRIVSLDKKDIQARYALLKYLYIAAQSSPGAMWQDVATQASEFIEIVETAGEEMVGMDTSKLEIPELKQKGESTHRLGNYLYLVRGRASFEAARLGLVTNKEESLKQAVADLEKVRQLEPQNPEVYLFLTRAAMLHGEIAVRKGDIDAKQASRNEALEILKQGLDATNNSVQANVNLLTTKYSFTQDDTEPNVKSRILTLEPDFLALENKFSSSPEVYWAKASFYADYRLGPAYLDKAIAAIDKAFTLDPNNVGYAILAANLYSKRYNILNQMADLTRANAILRQALTLPDAQETTGPRAMITRTNQIRLHGTLTLNHVNLILDPVSAVGETEGQQLLDEAQQSVRKIEQLYGSGEDPQVVKWQGMYELAQARFKKTDESAAIRKLYNIYTQFKASGRSDPSLSYILAKTFMNSQESGAVGDFLGNAVENGIETLRPNARLDYADLFVKATLWKWALASIDIFEQSCGVTDRSRILRIKANIIARNFEEAEKNLKELPQDDPNRMELTAMVLAGKSRHIRSILERRKEKPRTDVALQKILASRTQQQQPEVELRSTEQLMQDVKSHISAFSEYIDKLLEKDPNLVSYSLIASLCEDAITTGQTDIAKAITDKYLKYEPESATGLFYKRLLAEPNYTNVTEDKRKAMREEIITQTADPVKRALNLGIFYQMNNDSNKAAEQFKKLAGLPGEGDSLKPDDETRHRAIGFLFDIALDHKDWEVAEAICQAARRENIDQCSGDFFAARLAAAKEQYETALAGIDSALKQRPVFGYGYLLRARIHNMLDKKDAALADIQTAATINPMDRVITKEYANQLNLRNQRLGDNVSSAQIKELQAALDWAISLNPEDTGLTSFYAEYISETDPERALAIRQALQESTPNIQNSLLLARMATRLASEQAGQRRDVLLQMALAALEQAKSIDPQNPAVLESYAEYYQQTGRSEMAEQMLADQSSLLWRHYLRSGQYDDARKILEQSLAKNPTDVNLIKGMLFVAEKTNNRDGVKKYLDLLVAAQDTAENNLLLVQTYLQMGLLSEGEQKLASFREKHPAEGKGLILASWLSMKQGHLKEALDLINQRLENDQSDSMAWHLRGNLNLMMADYDQAIMDLKKSKSLLDSPATRILLAKTYLRTGRKDDAITELKPTAEDPQAPEEARLLLEQIYQRTGNKTQAGQFYRTMVEKLPDNIMWRMKAGEFAGIIEDYATAEKEYQTALKQSEERGRPNMEALDGYLKSLLYAKKYDKLFQEAGKYIDGNLATIAYSRMAEGKLRLGDRITAVQYCQNAVDKARNDGELAYQIQNMLSLVGDKEVEQLCTKKLEENPDSFTANLAMFLYRRIKGDYTKAIQHLDKCLASAGDNAARWENSAMQKAEVLILNYYKTSDNNNLKEAVKVYESVLEKQPNNTQVLNNIAYILAENDLDLDKALNYANRICELKPDDAGFLDTYAFVLYKKGNYEEAMRTSQKALQQYQAQGIATPAVAFEHLGQSQEKLGELNQARASYEQALEIGAQGMDKATSERITAALERLKNSGEAKEK